MPGTSSLNLTSAAALRDYVEDFQDELIVQGFYGHRTADYSTPHENVKGKKWLTNLTVQDLARRWAKQFTPTDDVIGFKPRALITEDAKVELQIYPKDFESTYLGNKRKKGQGMDIPFEGQIMMQVMKKLAQEFDFAHLNAVETATPLSTDLFKVLFNGLFALFTELQTGGHAPLVLPGGGITQNNILDIVNDLVSGLGTAYREGDIQVFMNKAQSRLFYNAWVAKYNGQKPNVTWANGVKKIELEEGEGEIIVLPSWNSNRMVATPPGNFHHGYDDITDATSFQFEQNKRSIDFWMDFKFGVQIFIPEEKALMFTT
jgi:hypothetical protein